MVYLPGKLYMSSDINDVSRKFRNGDIYCKCGSGTIESVNIVLIEEAGSNFGLVKIHKRHYDDMLSIGKLDTYINVDMKYEAEYSLFYHMNGVFYPDNTEETTLMNHVRIVHNKRNAPRPIFDLGPKFGDCFYHDQDDLFGNEEEEKGDDASDGETEEEDGKSTKRKISSNNDKDGNESDAAETDDRLIKRRRAETNDESSQQADKELFEETIINMMDMYDEATDYEGFDSKNIRAKFIEKCSGRRNFIELLMKALLVYVKAGNNVERMNFKRKDEKKSKDLIKSLNALDLGKSASTKDSLTLPRIGLAFMSELLVLRKTMVKDIQVQVDCLCEAEFQDVAFAGCPMINGKSDYNKFYKSFGGLISNNGKGYKENEEGSKKHDADTARWMKVACDGYTKDKTMDSRMEKALLITNKEDAVNFFGESYDVYIAE